MKIVETIRHDIVIIEPQGRLTVETEPQFREAVHQLVDTGWTRLVLNLAGVTSIDSCGLGAMVQECVSARRRGGDLKLLNVAGRNRQLLVLTKLLTVFEAYSSEDEALLSFGAPARERLSACPGLLRTHGSGGC